VWQDHRNAADFDIYAQRIDAQGVTRWTTDGVLVNGSSNDQTVPQAVPDGAGGVIVCWADYRFGVWDIYAQRLNASGTRVWTTNGVAVARPPGTRPVRPWPPTARRALIAWVDARYGNNDIYAQRLTASGVASWRSNGAAVCTLATVQIAPSITSDGSGGAFHRLDR